MDFFQRMEKIKPHLSQIIIQVIFAGMYIIARMALTEGMNHFVFVTYRLTIASLAIAPFAYILERKQRPKLTRTIIFQMFLLGTGTAISQNCIFPGLYYTSSTFGSAAFNLVPVLTFVMATFLRLEKVNVKTLGGQAKVIGTVICVSGAMVMTLYKGPALNFLSHDVKSHRNANNSKPNILLGSILVFGSVLVWSSVIAFQAPLLRRYPTKLSLTALTSLIGAIESAVIAVICERKKPKIWAIGWNIELLSVVYSGILGSAFAMFSLAWCISKRGPVFVALFYPVATIVTAILELAIVHVYLHVGSVVGAILIVVGLYAALWGKANDMKTKGKANDMKTKDDNACDYNITPRQSRDSDSSVTLVNNVTMEDEDSEKGRDPPL